MLSNEHHVWETSLHMCLQLLTSVRCDNVVIETKEAPSHVSEGALWGGCCS